jgi:hypothetical protein
MSDEINSYLKFKPKSNTAYLRFKIGSVVCRKKHVKILLNVHTDISKLFDDLDVVRIDTMYIGAKAKTSHIFIKILILSTFTTVKNHNTVILKVQLLVFSQYRS